MKTWITAGAVLLAGLGIVARGQIQPSIEIGNQTPVTNAPGSTLRGTWDYPDDACRVEIRQVGVCIRPPDPVTGAGHANNPLFLASYMGKNVLGTDPGMFSETLADRLPAGAQFFARVFDAPAPADALYYADSATFTNPPSHAESLDVVFQPFRLVGTGLPDADTDGDGIPDEMENEVTGTSPSRRDTDGDGYSDYFEVVHGDYLRATDPDPPLEIRLNPPVSAGPHTVSWWTIPVPGMQYRLEYRPQWVDGQAYSNIWSGTATDANVEVDVDAWMNLPEEKGFFRVVVP